MAINKFEKVKILYQVFSEYSGIITAIGLNSNDYKNLKNTEGFNDFFKITDNLNGTEFWNNIIVTNSPLIPKGKFYLK